MTGLAPTFRLPEAVTDAGDTIESVDQLVGYMEAGCRSADHQLLGLEYERLPLFSDGRAVPYASDDGPSVQAALAALAGHGWERQEDGGRLLGLSGPLGDVHLEPGAQTELALRPHATAGGILADLIEWRGSLREVAETTGVNLVALGLQPVTPIAEMEWVPKDRYRLMREHLGARGDLAHHMMKGSAGAQLTLDYHSEHEAGELIKAGLALSPLVNALCLNAPIEEGRELGQLSRRPEIWSRTDPERTGLLPWIFEDGFSFRSWVDWALAAPVMFFVRDGQWVTAGDASFTRLLDDPGDLAPITFADWHLHLTTLFPEVRIKQNVEIRGMDSCSIEHVAGLMATWRGLLHDPETRTRALDVVADASAEARQELHLGVGRTGLEHRFGDRRVAELSAEILALAGQGLDRLAAAAGEADGDRALLEPLAETAASGRVPAMRVLERFREQGPSGLVVID
ncbi:MAG: glutamate-cysteine ligase family protein [Acidobacteriota bacterium]